MKKLSFFLIISFFIHFTFAQCLSDFNLGNDTSLCSNQTLNLSIPNIYNNYSWQDNSIANTFQVNGPGTYFCTTNLEDNTNLIVNGNFEQGNSFFTTDYTYYPIADVFGPQASYGIINNANTWFNPFNACLDHTSGFGQMMVIDGSAFNGGNDAIWCQDISVQAGNNYKFTYWIQSVTNSNILANIQTRINGLIVDTELAPLGACIWQEREIFWTSTTTGMVSFCLYDLELAGNGNDFALDDLSLVQVCEYTDTIIVTQAIGDTIRNLEEICIGDSLFVEGAWQTQAGLYYDIVAGVNCDEILETQLDFRQVDTIKITTSICREESLFLGGGWQTQEGFYYDWIAGVNCDDVIETQLIYIAVDTTALVEEICEKDSFFVGGEWQTQAGLYYDFLPGNPCSNLVETNLILKPFPVADAGEDITISYEQIIMLSVNSNSINETFLWTSSTNFFSTNQNIDVEVFLPSQDFYLEVTENECTNLDTVTVFGIPLNLAIRVPDAFSPNLDGINDIFRLVNFEEFQQVKLYIYNRWGELIFKEEGRNPSWRGQYRSGKDCNIGSYVFYIEALPFNVDEVMTLSGNLTLIR